MKPQKNPQRKPKLKQWSKRLLVLLLAGGMLLGLTACEESLAFKEYDYWYESDEVDPDVDPLVDNDEQNEEETEDFWSETERDYSEDEREYEETESLHDDEADSEDESANALYSEEDLMFISAGESNVSSSDAEVTEDTTGTAASTDETSSSGYSVSGTDAASASVSGAGNASDDGAAILGGTEGDSDTNMASGVNDNDDEDSELNAGTNGNDETGTEGDNGAVGDEGFENGSQNKEDEQPVVACGAVIATGEAAILVQMLGGEGTLYATDQATYDMMAEYFPESELADVEILWSGDSTGSILADNLDTLMAEGKTPQAALLDSTALNTSDLSILADRGISCTTLVFDSYENILSAVDTAASVIGTDEAAQRRTEYRSFCESITELTGGYTSEKYTLFVSEWDSSAQLIFTTNKTGQWKSPLGIAIACMLSGSPADELWNLAGVQNAFSRNGYNRLGYDYSNDTSELLYGSEYQYLCQYYLSRASGEIKNPTYSYTMEVSVNWLLKGLGDTDYPAVIAATQEVASSWLADKKYSSETQDAGMYTVGQTFGSQRRLFDAGLDTGIVCRISDEYEVYVNPSGLGDWAEGSAESILEAVWVAWRIQGTCDESDVREKIKEYYAAFYRCTDMTDAQVDAVLAGKER